ncbi:V-type ATP synthase subunit D [Spirochaeta lutea]|uniref:ATP synthase subunit D n=1 Tax=Spirochaeta lutea TaxID=1480694 RepID=A0A098R0P5_9SPIO|nr:V-type ATP synthase subunit D [Spirochaeta lutea]KGE73735.1 ATP synthase subunit D [Spirochaeta lutea]
MAQVKLTKNELKKQKDYLKRYRRYLPTLQLKKQQLQMVLRQIEQKRKDLVEKRDAIYQGIESWIAVFGEQIPIADLIVIKGIKTGSGNIAGIDIPVFEELTFEDPDYDLFQYPLWVDRAIEGLKQILGFDAELNVLDKQYELISAELRTTSQRVNLFEKVKIPETRENIRKIQIYLGDQQTAAVVRGKISKGKLGVEGGTT